MVIRGIFTNTKLGPERMNSETTVPYIVANECPGLKRGDLVQFVGYDTKFQVVWTYIRSREQENYETVTISEINGKQINITGKNNMEQFGNMNVDNVFGDLTKDMYNEFMPQAEESARISITDGVLCFKNSDGAVIKSIDDINMPYIAITIGTNFVKSSESSDTNDSMLFLFIAATTARIIIIMFPLPAFIIYADEVKKRFISFLVRAI